MPTLRLALSLALFAGSAQAQEPEKVAPPAAAKAKAKNAPRPDDEDVALKFVQANHPELTEVLARLKPMKPAEYAKAVRELAQVSRSLDDLKGRDPKRYELGLDAWKARSRVDLLAARLASAPEPSSDLEAQLRQAVEAQVDKEILRLRYEREAAEARLKSAEANLKRAEERHDQTVANRTRNLIKNAAKSRGLVADKKPKSQPKPTTPKKDPGETQP